MSVEIPPLLRDSFAWLLALEALGLAGLAISRRVFAARPGLAIGLARPLGWLVVGWAQWLLASFDLLPNRRPTTLLLIALGVVALLRLHQGDGEPAIDRKAWIRLALLHLAAFLLLASIRAHDSELSTTEKPMDFALVNACLRSPWLPPHDPWLAGHPVSYYWFGHFLVALVVELSGVPAAVGYNLGLATVFAFTVGSAFALGRELAPRRRRPALAGAFAVLLLVFAGNFQGLLEFPRVHGHGSREMWRWIGVDGAFDVGATSHWRPDDNDWWWWRATRVINRIETRVDSAGTVVAAGPGSDYTITEFPAWSFLHGDLHAHLVALPLALLSLALARVLAAERRAWDRARLGAERGFVLVAAIVLGGVGFTNLWDLPTHAVLLFLATAFALEAQVGLLPRLKSAATFSAAVAVTAALIYLPAPLGFHSQAQGLVPVESAGTRPIDLLLVGGPPLCIAAAAVLFGFARVRVRSASFLAVLPAIALAAAGFVVPLASGVSVADRAAALALPGVLAALAAVVLVSRRHQQNEATEADTFAPLLAAAGFHLLLLVEVVRVGDLFGNRMNTVFKIHGQVWLLFAVAGAAALARAVERAGEGTTRSRIGIGLMAGLALVVTAATTLHPIAMADSKTHGFAGAADLDGSAPWVRRDRDDAGAVFWLAANASDDDVVAEATGPDYSDFARVAVYTGLSSVLGWAGHQVQWRGGDVSFRDRGPDLERIYGADDAMARATLRKLGVRWVFCGRLEREHWGDSTERRLAARLPVAHRSGSAVVFRVDR